MKDPTEYIGLGGRVCVLMVLCGIALCLLPAWGPLWLLGWAVDRFLPKVAKVLEEEL